MTTNNAISNHPTDAATLSIGEFARASGLSVSAVRFYADRGILTPVVVEAANGYRRYSEGQVEHARLIRDLRRIEMPLSTIIDVLDMSAHARNDAIETHLRQLEQRLVEVRHIVGGLASPTSTSSPDARTTIRARDLAQAVAQVTPFAGRDPRRPDMMCVRVEVREGSVRWVATDSHRLTIRDMVPAAFGGPFSVVVAAATLHEWSSALTSNASVSLQLEDGDLVARGDGVDLRCPGVPTEFPDYEGVLSRSTTVRTSLVLDRNVVLSMLESFDGEDTIVLTTSDTEISATRDDMNASCPATVDGPAVLVAVNPRYAADAVEHAVGSDVVLEIDQPDRAVTFRSADDGTYTSLLMPVKLD